MPAVKRWELNPRTQWFSVPGSEQAKSWVGGGTFRCAGIQYSCARCARAESPDLSGRPFEACSSVAHPGGREDHTALRTVCGLAFSQLRASASSLWPPPRAGPSWCVGCVGSWSRVKPLGLSDNYSAFLFCKSPSCVGCSSFQLKSLPLWLSLKIPIFN